jgi:hypothetical protein
MNNKRKMKKIKNKEEKKNHPIIKSLLDLGGGSSLNKMGFIYLFIVLY